HPAQERLRGLPPPLAGADAGLGGADRGPDPEPLGPRGEGADPRRRARDLGGRGAAPASRGAAARRDRGRVPGDAAEAGEIRRRPRLLPDPLAAGAALARLRLRRAADGEDLSRGGGDQALRPAEPPAADARAGPALAAPARAGHGVRAAPRAPSRRRHPLHRLEGHRAARALHLPRVPDRALPERRAHDRRGPDADRGGRRHREDRVRPERGAPAHADRGPVRRPGRGPRLQRPRGAHDAAAEGPRRGERAGGGALRGPPAALRGELRGGLRRAERAVPQAGARRPLHEPGGPGHDGTGLGLPQGPEGTPRASLRRGRRPRDARHRLGLAPAPGGGLPQGGGRAAAGEPGPDPAGPAAPRRAHGRRRRGAHPGRADQQVPRFESQASALMPDMTEEALEGDRIRIETPEHVVFEYELAGLVSRIMAATIDLIVIGFIMLGLFLAVLAAVGGLQDFAPWAIALGAIAAFLVIWGYPMFFEIFWKGQTPGKRSLGMRVFQEGGYSLTPQVVIVRNLLRFVDFLPGAYFLGLLVMMLNRRYKRVGDFVAGTIVIRERSSSATPPQMRMVEPVPVGQEERVA